MTDRRDAVGELAAWALEAPDRLLPARIFRLRAMRQVLGIDRYRIPLPEPSEDQPFVPDYVASDDPMPCPLGDWVERRIVFLHAPRLHISNSLSTYSLPPWLLRFRPRKTGLLPNGLRARIDRGDPPSIRIEDLLTSERPTPEALHEVILLPQTRSERRRERLWEHARLIRRRLEGITGRESSSRTWLQRTIDDPEASEDRALAIWNAFVAEFETPASCRTRGEFISLRDQLIPGRNPGEGRTASNSPTGSPARQDCCWTVWMATSRSRQVESLQRTGQTDWPVSPGFRKPGLLILPEHRSRR